MQAEMSIFAQHGLRCPITAGLPTKLSAESWEKTCATMRKPRPAYHGGYPTVPHKICSLCAGKHRPEELEIIDMAQDTCDACGEKKTLSNNRGKKVCSSCAALYGAANNRPELVLQILRELKPELLDERLPVQDNVSELEQQLYRSREYAHELEGKLMAAEDRIDALLANLRATKEGQLREVTGGKHSIHESALLDLALDALKGKITGLKAEQIEALRGMA